MIEYKEKFYRALIKTSGLHQYQVKYGYTDILISSNIEDKQIPILALNTLKRFYNEFNDLKDSNPDFSPLFNPLNQQEWNLLQ